MDADTTNGLRAKVLIAEDDAIVALDLQGMVSRLGYDVVAIVENGPTAIAAVQRFQPDIILLDMVLTGPLDGIEVAREIQKERAVPIIFCVSSPDLSILIRAKEISYAGYLLKPISPDSLSTTLDTALYKFKLERRVEQAEARFRLLSDKSEIVESFFADKAAFSWAWTAETGSHVSAFPDEPDERIVSIESAIDARCASASVASGGAAQRLSFLIGPIDTTEGALHFAALGTLSPDGARYTGFLVPLDVAAP
ncbi:MAG TPA: response regulator [Treponemataceae bacterium]|jgi:CheY-like chemotaxis protein|nr:response regulator [Treponemataceae bacterium]